MPPKKGKSGKAAAAAEVVEEKDEYAKAKMLIKPDDQLELPEKDMEEQITRVLTMKNMQYPDSLVQYSFAKSEYVFMPLPGDTLVLMNVKGIVLEQGTPEARAQLMAEGKDVGGFGQAEAPIEEADTETITEPVSLQDDDVVEDEEEEEEGEGGADEPEETEEGGGGKPKKIMNQFNYCERAALTYSNAIRSSEAQTVPPPRATYSNQVYQWLIYDTLMEDYAEQQKATEKVHHRPGKKKGGKKKALSKKELLQIELLKNWNILERMINLNSFDDILQDCRYWEDPSDEFRVDEGTLLPLWKFSYEKTKKMTVTDICWNPWYYDLMAVTFGSFDCSKITEEGYLCLFSLKNPSYPESICVSDSGLMCVDIHPRFPYFVAVGQFDGNVAVWNIQQTTKEPQFKSHSVNQKHFGIVWEVQWAKDLPDGDLNFFSISGDGKVNQWVLQLSSLTVTTVMHLYMDLPPVSGPDGTTIRLKGCGSALRLRPDNPLNYLVGTEEGLIHECSTQYSFLYINTYYAHDLPVYRIDFNKFNSNVFISCSGDWRIKIWESTSSEPMFTFDLGTCVGDVRWAPYSSTVFAAVTNDGKVHVFDLGVNKYKAICTQNIVNRRFNKLTRIAFNTKLPIILVGDDKGCVTSLKLSPNLRKLVKATKKQANIDQTTLQVMKLDRLLSLMREPKKLERPPDVIEED